MAITYGETLVNSSVHFGYEYENAYNSYTSCILSKYLSMMGNEEELKKEFPDGDLQSCTKEEAIAFCRPYAEIIGYGNAEVDVYTLTQDVLQKNANKIPGITWSAPIPGYKKPIVTEKEYKEAYESGGDQALWELEQRYKEETNQYVIPWEKKDEAFLLNYHIEYNGIPIESTLELIMIYAPQYEHPVYVGGLYAFEEIAAVQMELAITSDDAIKKLLASKGLESMEGIEIRTVEPVYQCEMVDDETLGECNRLMPYWKIGYVIKNNNVQTDMLGVNIAMVDAVYGEMAP